MLYAGQYFDWETNFYYLRARFYDPTTGQFLSRDPFNALTRSAYGYVGGSPLNRTDPSGLFAIPGTDWCVDIGDANCNSIKEQNAESSQQVADFAGGVLNGITLGNGQNALNVYGGQGDKVNWDSGYAFAGNIFGTALQVPLVFNPASLGLTAAQMGRIMTVASSTALYSTCARGAGGIWSMDCVGHTGVLVASNGYAAPFGFFGKEFRNFMSLILGPSVYPVDWSIDNCD